VHDALAPVQLPPQVPEPAHAARDPCGGPDGTVVQVPCTPATSHAWHAPEQARSQQYPSTQLPEVHWAADVQAELFATVPHDPATHGLPTQSPAAAHVRAQAVPAHLNGAHVTAAAALHSPAPLQVEPLVAWLVAASHDPPPQLVPFGQSSQAPWPSHLPSSPQVDWALAWQVGCAAGGAAPAATGEHLPMDPARLHC